MNVCFSYDYDAPVTEAGDLTDKWWAVREVVGRFLPLPPLPSDLQNVTVKEDYGSVTMNFVSTLFDSMAAVGSQPVTSHQPLTFEALNQSFGLVVYETVLGDGPFIDPVLLSVPGLRDRGYVFLGGRPAGVLSREHDIYEVPVQAYAGQKLTIVVENQGRICYGQGITDPKGILGNVTLGGSLLSKWRMTGVPLLDGEGIGVLTDQLKQFEAVDQDIKQRISSSLATSEGKMTFWQGNFTVSETESLDTFLSLPGWHKGVAFVNGFNIGRYWPETGPQVTLYIPSILLTTGTNTIILLEQDKSPCTDDMDRCTVQLVDEHTIDGPTP